MSDEFDDLLGGDVKPARETRLSMAETRMREATKLAEIRRAGAGMTKISVDEFLLPVNKNFIARVLHMDPMTVTKRLRDCPIAGTVGSGRPVYYFHEALPYLLKPKMDIATYIKSLNPADLPNSINKSFWEAERIKNDVMLKTGEAWSTMKVLEVLGEVFMLIKDRMPLIQEAMRDMEITDEAQTKLQEMCDQFQQDLHEALIEMPKRRQTFSRQADIEPGDTIAPDFDDEGGDETD